MPSSLGQKAQLVFVEMESNIDWCVWAWVCCSVIWCHQELQKRASGSTYSQAIVEPAIYTTFVNKYGSGLLAGLSSCPLPTSLTTVVNWCFKLSSFTDLNLHLASVWGVRSHLFLNSRHKIPNLFSRRDTHGYKVLPTNMSVGNLNAFILQLVIYSHIFICQISQN
jgi:hypothetical protein